MILKLAGVDIHRMLFRVSMAIPAIARITGVCGVPLNKDVERCGLSTDLSPIDERSAGDYARV